MNGSLPGLLHVASQMVFYVETNWNNANNYLTNGNNNYSCSWQFFLFLFVAVIIVIILIRFFFAYGITRITMNGPRITHEYYYMEHYMGHYMWITCSVADKNSFVWD